MINKRDKKTFLGVITARGGSKRLPAKNVLDLAGKPLIGWTIDAALESKYIDELIVSTEDEEIADISKTFGANVPFMRPKELSADNVHPVEVVIHAVNYFLNEHKKEFDYVLFLQPTSPLRNEHDIDKAIEFLYSSKADAVISVCEAEHSPLWYNILPEDLSMKNFLRDDLKAKMSQDLPMYYRVNGAIYLCKTKRLLKENTFFLKDNIFAFLMDVKRSVDIDSLVDFKLAEILMQTNMKNVYPELVTQFRRNKYRGGQK